MADLKKEGFTVDGVAIAPPTTYKPVFATTSTKSSKRDQELTMHNSPMGISTVDIPNAALQQKRMITAYIYISDPEEGKTVNTIYMMVNSRKAPEGFEIPEDIDLFHHTLAAAAEYQRRAEKAKNQSEAKAEEAESWAHGHEKYPDRTKDNAKYYAAQAAGAVEEVSGRTKKAKEDIDNYARQKETELKGDTGNVNFAAFKVVKGRLKMYSDPTVDKVCFRRVGSRLKYRLKI